MTSRRSKMRDERDSRSGSPPPGRSPSPAPAFERLAPARARRARQAAAGPARARCQRRAPRAQPAEDRAPAASPEARADRQSPEVGGQAGGMSWLDRLRGWWNKDARETAEEEAGMTQAERDVAEEDYEGRKDDTELRGGYLAGGVGDYERDSEPPPPDDSEPP